MKKNSQQPAGFKASKAQAELIRRLTQKANRRIKQAFKLYEAAGKHRIPGALTEGRVTVREDWQTEKNPLSRAIKFPSERAFQAHVNYLKKFDLPEVKGGLPTMTEFSQIQTNKIILALETSIGGGSSLYNMPPEIMQHMYKIISRMTAPEQTEFWKVFSKRGQKLLDKFSSKQAMEQALNEFFGREEIRPLLIKSIVEAQGIKTVAAQKAEFDKLKHYNNKALANYLNTLR